MVFPLQKNLLFKNLPKDHRRDVFIIQMAHLLRINNLNIFSSAKRISSCSINGKKCLCLNSCLALFVLFNVMGTLLIY